MEQEFKVPVQPLLPLPYDEIGPSVSRNRARELNRINGGKSGRETLRIDVNKIIIREGFNWRIKPEGMSMEQWLHDSNELDIENLAKGLLKSGGSVDPIHVDLLDDGNYYLEEGFRRVMATRWLLEQGHDQFSDGSDLHLIEAFINPKETTELDRMRKIFTSQDNLKLKGMELAMGLLRMKTHYNMTHEEIALEIGKSRQWVDNKIGLALEPEPIRNALISGHLTETAATNLRQNVKSETDRVHQVQESIAKGEALKVRDVQRKPTVKEASTDELLIDASEEKQMAEFELNESISMLDGMEKHWKGLPVQTRDDLCLLKERIIKKIEVARTFIQQAPDKR